MPVCPNCGKEVSEGVTVCPDCGQRLKKGFTSEERQKYIQELEASVEEKKPAKKTKITKKQLAGIIAVVIIVIVIIATRCIPEETQPFSEQAVTVGNVYAALNKLRGTDIALRGSMTDIQVFPHAGTDNPNDFIVHVYFKPESVWDEQHAMRIAVQTSIKAMETLFQNQAIGEVVMWEQLDFTDIYGNTETKTAIRLLMPKTTAAKIVDWGVIADRAWADYNTFFELAELQYTHPAIAKEL